MVNTKNEINGPRPEKTNILHNYEKTKASALQLHCYRYTDSTIPTLFTFFFFFFFFFFFSFFFFCKQYS